MGADRRPDPARIYTFDHLKAIQATSYPKFSPRKCIAYVASLSRFSGLLKKLSPRRECHDSSIYHELAEAGMRRQSVSCPARNKRCWPRPPVGRQRRRWARRLPYLLTASSTPTRSRTRGRLKCVAQPSAGSLFSASPTRTPLAAVSAIVWVGADNQKLVTVRALVRTRFPQCQTVFLTPWLAGWGPDAYPAKIDTMPLKLHSAV
jgi:hypothetical protein